MPLPRSTQSNQTAQQAPTLTEGITLRTERKVFEKAPAGMHPAVLAEITQIQVEEDEKASFGWSHDSRRSTGKRMADKVILSFELEATYQDPKSEFFGKRMIITMDAYTTFNNPKNKLVKMCASWANVKELSEEQMKVWAAYLSAPMFFPDGARNPESLVGSPCTLKIIHGIGKTSGREYAAIETVMSPTPGHEDLSISADYTPYHQRMANAERMRVERQENQQSHPGQKDEFKGQF